MKFQVIARYNTRAEACAKVRELNDVRESNKMLTTRKYNYEVIRHSEKGKMCFLVVKPQGRKEKPFSKNNVNYHETKLQKQQREYREKHIAEIMEMANNKVPYRKIAEKFKVSAATIGLWVYKVRQGIYTV